MKKHNHKQGFTMLETTLVLAIAGLIFTMVFIALPALRASANDSERRDDVSELLTVIAKYQTNNRGALPETAIDLAKYLDTKEFTDPSGDSYNIQISECSDNTNGCVSVNEVASTSAFPNEYKMYVLTGASCNGDKAISSNNPRKVAVIYRLEGSGVYCSSN